MKVLCVIDHLGSGGAQGQMINLAIGLKAKGHWVEIFIYYPEFDHFRPVLERAGVPIHEVSKRRGFSLSVLFRLIRLLRQEQYDDVISFLRVPNVYVELSRVFSPRLRLIVSERNSHHDDPHPYTSLALRMLHGLADVVTTNSYSHADWLRKLPWLRRKTATIYNGYALGLEEGALASDKPPLKLLVIGRVCKQKNGLRLLEALSLFHQKHGYIPRVAWVGRREGDKANARYCQWMDDYLKNNKEIAECWEWLGQRSDVLDLLKKHRALILPSVYEGLPNVVCEAFFAGLPVLASNVCDHPRLVEEGKRGFLFDPDDPASIADAIERLVNLDGVQWRALSRNAQRYAVDNLNLERMVDDYERLLKHPGD